jgi:hypothetical protein
VKRLCKVCGKPIVGKEAALFVNVVKAGQVVESYVQHGDCT